MREVLIAGAVVLAAAVYLNNIALLLLGVAIAASGAILSAPTQTAPEEVWKRIAEGSWVNVQLILEALPPAAKAYYVPSAYAPRPLAVVGAPRPPTRLAFKDGEVYVFIPPGSALVEYCRDVIGEDPAESAAACLTKTGMAKRVVATPLSDGVRVEMEAPDLLYGGTVAEYVFGSWAASLAAAATAEAAKRIAYVEEERKEGKRRVVVVKFI